MRAEDERQAPQAEARILTPDQRLRVFVSSTLSELAEERAAARRAIERLRLTPVMFELGARPHPPRSLYLAYLRQSQVFIGIYGERYGWTAPDMDVSGLEDEFLHAGDMPRLLYIKTPATGRDPHLTALIARIQETGGVSYRTYSSPDELESLVVDDLAVLITERFTASPSERPALHVPRPASEFVGRSREIAELVDLITSGGVRLVTLTGPGGVGKTRLAIEVARAAADGFADGVAFIPLAAREPDDFLEAVATAIGLNDLGQEPLADLLAAALRRRRELLVFDNFEQLIPAAGEIARLIEQTCELRLLVTSRTALRLSGEEEFPVFPLGVPRITSRAEEVARAESAQLFAERVAAVRHGYRITGDDAATVAHICQRLDGLPLAVELVAARANVMSIDDLSTRLDTVLDLAARSPDTPERHRTLRQTMDWSYSQLPRRAAAAFAQLGVFKGSISVPAAEAVVALDEPADMLDILAVLVDHSLLSPHLDDHGARFSMLEIVREYARSKLDPSTNDAARARHADYYRGIAEAAFEGLRGTGQRSMVEQLDLDADDIAAALDWLLESDRRIDVADMCWALWLYYWLRNAVTEGRRWTRGALDAAGPLPRLQRGRLLAADAFLATWRRDFALAGQELGEAQVISEQEGDADLRILTNIMLIVVFGALGNADGARAVAADAIRLARERSDLWSEAVALSGLCWLNAAVGRFAGEEATFERTLTIATEVDDPLWLAMARDNMAELLMWQGRIAEAVPLVVESVTTLAELRMAYAGVGTLNTAAYLLSLYDRWREAVLVQAGADAVLDTMDAGLMPFWAPRRERLLAGARDRLGNSVYERARQTGCDWSFEEAAASAIATLMTLVDEPSGRDSPASSAPLGRVPYLHTAADDVIAGDDELREFSDDELAEGISRLRDARNAVILAHNYQVPAVQDIADFVGDSLELARQAAGTTADVIVLCGVHFMAETAALLCLDRRVLIPDLEAGCSLAQSVTAGDVRAWRAVHPGGVVVSYVNTDASVKAESDFCCTSANAVDVVRAIEPDREILFLPDQFLGMYIETRCRRTLDLWMGECHVHAAIRPEDVDAQLDANPGAHLLLHPECGCASQCLWRLSVGDLPADRTEVLSTSGMVRHARSCDAPVDLVGTEVGVLHRLRKENGVKQFIPVRDDAICAYMKTITLAKVYRSLRDDVYPVTIAEPTATGARRALERMLEIA
jgi:quinolinate synthetase A subunit